MFTRNQAMRNPKSLDLTLAVEFVAYVINNYAELFLLNPYRELIRMSEFDERTRGENVLLTKNLQKIDQRAMKFFNHMNHQRFTLRLQARVFMKWKLQTLMSKVDLLQDRLATVTNDPMRTTTTTPYGFFEFFFLIFR
jgi:hypothetical protein